MKTIGEGIQETLGSLSSSNDAAHKAARIAQVRLAWKNAVEAVYKDAAEMVLNHINAVYIVSAATRVNGSRNKGRIVAEPGQSTSNQLIVYVDDSLIRSDLDARQEFLKLHLKEQGENVDEFCILPSRFEMKERHPFDQNYGSESIQPTTISPTNKTGHNFTTPTQPSTKQPGFSSLDPDVQRKVQGVENDAVRSSLEKAINAELARNDASYMKNGQ